jgi:hypothetical protein
MKYKESEVIDIISTITDKDPLEILNVWNDKKANTPLDLEKRKYDHFVYSFPMIVGDEEVATITLVSLYGGDLNSKEPDLMQKYFGHKKYNESWYTFSHDSFLSCYLTIHKDFELPEVVEEFYVQKFNGLDAEGQPFEFEVSYGFPKEGKNQHLFGQWVSSRTYRFDNDVNIEVERMNGWLLGDKINENIKNRINERDNIKNSI